MPNFCSTESFCPLVRAACGHRHWDHVIERLVLFDLGAFAARATATDKANLTRNCHFPWLPPSTAKPSTNFCSPICNRNASRTKVRSDAIALQIANLAVNFVAERFES